MWKELLSCHHNPIHFSWVNQMCSHSIDFQVKFKQLPSWPIKEGCTSFQPTYDMFVVWPTNWCPAILVPFTLTRAASDQSELAGASSYETQLTLMGTSWPVSVSDHDIPNTKPSLQCSYLTTAYQALNIYQSFESLHDKRNTCSQMFVSSTRLTKHFPPFQNRRPVDCLFRYTSRYLPQCQADNNLNGWCLV